VLGFRFARAEPVLAKGSALAAGKGGRAVSPTFRAGSLSEIPQLLNPLVQAG